MGLFRQQVDRFLDRRVQIEIDDLQIEFPRLDLREIKDIVDNGQEGLSRGAHGLGILLPLASAPCRGAIPVIPITPFMGVRIS